MENNNINSLELEEMRQQMTALKSQLDEQLQLNETTLQKNIMSKAKSVNSMGSRMLLVGVLTAIFVPAIFYYMYDFSILCCTVTSLVVIADASLDYWSAHRIKPSDISGKNFSETTATLISMKKSNQWQLVIGIIVMIPLMIWWSVEMLDTKFFDFTTTPEAVNMAKYSIIGCGVIGSIIGLFIAMRIYYKQKRNIDDLINMLK